MKQTRGGQPSSCRSELKVNVHRATFFLFKYVTWDGAHNGLVGCPLCLPVSSVPLVYHVYQGEAITRSFAFEMLQKLG